MPPVDDRIFLAYLAGIRREFVVLGKRLEFAFEDPREFLHQQFAAECCEAILQVAGGLVSPDFDRRACQYRAGIEPRFHLHQAYPRYLVTFEYCRLNRSGAAPARQQRCVYIHATALRNVEYHLWQQQSVGRDDQQVGFSCGDFRDDTCILERFRLPYGNVMLSCELLDRTLRQLAAAAGAPVRLRQHGSGNEARLE